MTDADGFRLAGSKRDANGRSCSITGGVSIVVVVAVILIATTAAVRGGQQCGRLHVQFAIAGPGDHGTVR